jgi:2,4-dienoyl-CoA reductase-like NADH-dependent reductase (Old Yellow Enzyme family)
MERETVDRLARATGCLVTPNVIGNPMFTMTTHELHMFAEKIVEIVALECMDLVDVGGEFVSRPKLVEKIREHFGVEE